MKHAQSSAKTAVHISDTAMDRARRAMSKVAYSSAKIQQIARAAQKLPDVSVMAEPVPKHRVTYVCPVCAASLERNE